jgi:nucleoside-diphosphate-sugar epimerase
MSSSRAQRPAFVTGATGFIGRALALRLAAAGTPVLALVRDPTRAGDLAAAPGVEIVRGGLGDRALLRELAARAGVVYHLAGLTSARSRAEFLAVNAAATGALAAASAAAPDPPQFVYVSSLAVAGPRTAADPAREDDPPAPITPYGESKLRGEELLAREGAGLRRVVVRPPWVYGPGDRQSLPLFRMAARGFFPAVRGGCMEVSLVHVDDLVEALVLAGASPRAAGRVYYATDGAVHTVAEIGAALLAASGGGRTVRVPGLALRLAGLAGEAASLITRRPVLLGRHKACEGLQEGWVCDDARIRAELGYRPRTGLAEGVAATLVWYRRHGWL